MAYDYSLGDAINNAASQYGIDAGLLNTIHAIEGNGTSSAGAQGPFQLMPKTALSLGVTNPFDPQQAANGAAQLVRQNYQALSSALGRAPADWEQYLAYQQGAGGALALLKADPSSSAVSARGSSAAITGNGGTGDMSTGDFLSMWQQRFNQKAGQVGYGGSGGSASAATSAPSPDAGSGSFWSVATWQHWGSRIGVFVLGLVFVAAGLILFGLVRTNVGTNIIENIVPVRNRVRIDRGARSAPKIEAPAAPSVDKGDGMGDYGRNIVKLAAAKSIAKSRKVSA